MQTDGESSRLRPPPWCPGLCNPKQMQFPRGDERCSQLLSAEKSKAVAEVTLLSLRGKVLARVAMKLQQHCGEILENRVLLGTVKDRIDWCIYSWFIPGLYQCDTGVSTPVASLHVGACVTGVGETASYRQKSWFLNAVVVPMLVLSWPFLLPTCIGFAWQWFGSRGGYRSGFCEKLLEASPIFNKANASQLQVRLTAGQG